MKRLVVVPPAPKTVLERFAEMADEEFARAEELQKRVDDLESQTQPRLNEILDLKVEVRNARAAHLLLTAAASNVLAAHEVGDDAMLDAALARMEEIVHGTVGAS